MSESESEYYESSKTFEQKSKSSSKPVTDTNKKRKPRASLSNSTPPSKKSNTVSDVFGIRQNRGPASTHNEDGTHQLASFFVNRVGNGCERRTASTEGEYYVDCKVYKTEDARSVDSLELWKKALVRIKLQTNTDSPQWRTLQKFVQSTDTLFVDPPKFFDK